MNWFARTQGREVFAIPGKVDSNTSFGTNELIKQGAKLVSSCEDILEEFVFEPAKEEKILSCRTKSAEPGLNSEETVLYGLLSDEPLLFDEIAEKTKLDISAISDILLRLQMHKLIRQLPGKQFIRTPADK